MNVALNVALQQQHDRYAAQACGSGGGSSYNDPLKKQLYAGIYEKQLISKGGKIILGTREAWKHYFKYAKLVAAPADFEGYVFITEAE